MDACSTIGESTDAIVMDDSPIDEKEIQEACQRWVFFLSVDFFVAFRVTGLLRRKMISSRRECVSCDRYCSTALCLAVFILWTMGLCHDMVCTVFISFFP